MSYTELNLLWGFCKDYKLLVELRNKRKMGVPKKICMRSHTFIKVHTHYHPASVGENMADLQIFIVVR